MSTRGYAEQVASSIMNDADSVDEAVYFIYDSGDRKRNNGYSLDDLREFYGELLGEIELRRIGLGENPNPSPAARENIAKLKAAEAAAQKRLLSIQEESS